MSNATRMIYVVTDRNDADRQSPIIDMFTSREAAENLAAEWSADYGTCEVEEHEKATDAADFNDVCNAIEMHFKNRENTLDNPLKLASKEELAAAIHPNLSYEELKARFEDGGMEQIYCFA